jgi:hypothetical protein
MSGCGTPVAPGYKIQKEALAVRFIPGSPPHLAVRAQYTLANVGNAPLHFIGVELPGDKTFGRADLHAQIDGKEITLQHNPHEAADDWRIPMPVAWRQKEKLNLILSYDLAARTATDPRIFAAANAFSLNDSGWLPALMGFQAFLSPSIVRPNPTDLNVTVPADFRVTASGQLRGAKKQNGESEYQFRIHKGDFDPYIVAGQYNEQRVSAAGSDVVIWTTKPISAAQAQQATAQIGAAGKFYTQTFGALPVDMKSVYDAEFPQSAWIPQTNWEGVLLPGVVNSFSGATGKLQLAYTWFGHVIRPNEEAWMLGGAFAHYAAKSLDEKGGASRSEAVSSSLTNYDAERSKAVEKPIISLTRYDPADQLQIGGDKMELFMFALEDKCDQQNLTHAISDMVYALRGEEYGYTDFRAALEQQCHQDLGSLFRTWLTRPGIPPDFRARYESAGGSTP